MRNERGDDGVYAHAPFIRRVGYRPCVVESAAELGAKAYCVFADDARRT